MRKKIKSPLLELQVRIAKARWVELRERLKASPKVLEAVEPKVRWARTASRAGLIFSLHHLKKWPFKKIAQLFDLTPTGVANLCHALEREYFLRTLVPVFHALEGDGWLASNCWVEQCGRAHDQWWPASDHRTDSGWIYGRKFDKFPSTLMSHYKRAEAT